MRIVNRKQFLELPEGVLFSKYAPCYFENIMIKGESLPNDFCYQQIVDAVKCHDSNEYGDILDRACETGESFDLDFCCQGRDGCFDEDQLFAVWEQKDIGALMARLASIRPGERGMTDTQHDLLRAPTGETAIMDAYKSNAFLQQNPTWAIVGVNLRHDTTKTPFGDIGAVIE